MPRPRSPAAKPIYIYPGLMRMHSARAVALDAACPASVYAAGRGDDHHSCSICLDVLKPSRDIVRQLPCSHVFHSRCILTWISSADRCPLCNDTMMCSSEPSVDAEARPRSARSQKRSGGRSVRVSVPDVDPSTFCELGLGSDARLALPSALDERKNTRTYSFILHDQARFHHWLEDREP